MLSAVAKEETPYLPITALTAVVKAVTPSPGAPFDLRHGTSTSPHACEKILEANTDTHTDIDTVPVTGTRVRDTLGIIRNWHQINILTHIHIQVPRFPEPYWILDTDTNIDTDTDTHTDTYSHSSDHKESAPEKYRHTYIYIFRLLGSENL